VGGWDYGLLGIRQDSFGDVDADELIVGRVSANVLEESAVGLIATIGDPTSNVENSLIGADFRYLNTRLASGKTLQGSLWYQQSDTSGIDGDDAAYGFALKAPNTEGWSGDLVYKEIDHNFRPALGFAAGCGAAADDKVRFSGQTRRDARRRSRFPGAELRYRSAGQPYRR
jgi:hypothetical protein